MESAARPLSVASEPQAARQDDLMDLLSVLPQDLQRSVPSDEVQSLIEIVLDLGRPPEFRLTKRVIRLLERPVERGDIEHVVDRLGEFSGDNRAGIERTLHRISAIRSRKGDIIGLTLRVGRTIYGTIDILRDLIETGKNVLLLGRPGVGKTTKLREMAHVLADDFQKRVIVIDTSNEIGGDGDIPHPAIGGARRMQVRRPDLQHAVMIEAVENHMPEVIIVDEIGTESEAAAARTIAERGVQLIGTAHGTTLENLLMNPTLSDLVGGVHTVTLSDEEARRRRTTKTINERRAPPTFDILVEIVDHEEVIVHRDIADAVDTLLNGFGPRGEHRRLSADGQFTPPPEEPVSVPGGYQVAPSDHVPGESPVRIYPYAVSRELLDRVIRNLGIEARTVREPSQAELVLSLRSREDDIQLRKSLEGKPIPIHSIKKNSASQMRRILQDLFSRVEGLESEDVKDAVSETEYAIQRVISEKLEVSLAPRTPPLRKMQHRIVSRYHLQSQSVGNGPRRHLIIYPYD